MCNFDGEMVLKIQTGLIIFHLKYKRNGFPQFVEELTTLPKSLAKNYELEGIFGI